MSKCKLAIYTLLIIGVLLNLSSPFALEMWESRGQPLRWYDVCGSVLGSIAGLATILAICLQFRKGTYWIALIATVITFLMLQFPLSIYLASPSQKSYIDAVKWYFSGDLAVANYMFVISLVAILLGLLLYKFYQRRTKEEV